MRIAIVGDTHLDETISSRTDNYLETCFNKLEEVSKHCNEIIILGDFLNRPTLSIMNLIKIYNFLLKLKSSGVKVSTILGNHDIFNENEESLNKTSIGLLYAAEAINIIFPEKPYIINNLRFNTSYVNFKKAHFHLKSKQFEANDILLLHLFYEDRFTGFTKEDFNLLNCSKIFLGHQHCPYEKAFKDEGNFKVYRPGSLLRSSADQYNLTRSPIYYIINENQEIEFHTLDNVQSSKDIFTVDAYERKNYKQIQFLENINDTINRYIESGNNMNKNSYSIRSTLQELHTPVKDIEYIESKYSTFNLKFD